MQAITWSPELSTVVKDMKELANKGIASVSKALSQKENRAVTATFGVQTQKPEVQRMWA